VATLSSAPGTEVRGREAIRRIRRGDAGYPARLDCLDTPPAELWTRGPLNLDTPRAIAIVGTRTATGYGRRVAHDLAFDLAGAGWSIVSGLARGIDSAAHRGALEAGGTTIAILGCGIDQVYPARNRGLREEIALSGLLVTEYEPGTPPLKHHFPSRNRIIAALARAVVVVQAGERSGALITADLALELGRDVLAVPGPVDQPGSRGVNRLLRDGAGLVESAADVLDALDDLPGMEATRAAQTFLFGEDPEGRSGGVGKVSRRLVELLAAGPARVEELAWAAGLPVAEALSELSRMELAGSVRSLPGGRFERVAR
jgi:DNA processing protein